MITTTKNGTPAAHVLHTSRPLTPPRLVHTHAPTPDTSTRRHEANEHTRQDEQTKDGDTQKTTCVTASRQICLAEEVSEGRGGERCRREGQRGRGIGGGRRSRGLGGRRRGDERGGHGGDGDDLHPETGHLRLLGTRRKGERRGDW